MKCSVCKLPDQTKCELYASCMESEYVMRTENRERGPRPYEHYFEISGDGRLLNPMSFQERIWK